MEHCTQLDMVYEFGYTNSILLTDISMTKCPKSSGNFWYLYLKIRRLYAIKRLSSWHIHQCTHYPTIHFLSCYITIDYCMKGYIICEKMMMNQVRSYLLYFLLKIIARILIRYFQIGKPETYIIYLFFYLFQIQLIGFC